jgi:hypothetical protein
VSPKRRVWKPPADTPVPSARASVASAPSASRTRLGDGGALLILAALTALVVWNRLDFDAWLTRFDLFTFFLPWYTFLGDRVRELQVPGWNPHLFSGAPFAGDPESGWMYLPAMLFFALLSTTAAFKGMVAFQLAAAALSTYALARVLGMGAFASLVAGVVYVVGPFLHWNTYCCLIFSQFATWIPLALLGIELALRAGRWRDRVAPWFLAGFAISQMFAGWIGEGWLYAVLLPAAYVGYRTLFPPPGAPPRPSPPLPAHRAGDRLGGGWREGERWERGDSGTDHPDLASRLLTGAVTGVAVIGLGVALGAAGMLPRFAVNAETNLAGGDYSRIEGGGVLNPPWHLDYLLAQVLGTGTGYHFRAASFGGAVVVLALLAPVVAGRRFAVPFFAGLTLVALILTLETTPLHLLFYLIPRYREFHDHDAWRTMALAAIGPAMLSAATITTLPRWRGRRALLPIVFGPLLLLIVVAVALWRDGRFLGWEPLVAAGMTTALIAIAVAAPLGSNAAPIILTRFANAVPALVLAVIFLLPTGVELTGSWLGWPGNAKWEQHWRPHPVAAPTLAKEVQRADSGGAGRFLQAQLAVSGPFRYVGYGGFGYLGDDAREKNYMERRFDPNIQALLVNGRPIYLGLYDIQGYNPLQLSRYVDFMAALNEETQDYHTAFLLPSGAGSPLLDLLDVRYVLIDTALPRFRQDVVALTAGSREVFRTPQVVVYERLPAPPHAWIVHDVRAVARGDALPLLTIRAIDPYRTALVEGTPPQSEEPPPSANESARVTRYEPDMLTIETTSAAPGLLVVSEIYALGWRATVDGEDAPVLATDHALRGVPLPAGEHTVAFHYEPTPLRLGLTISGIAWVAMIVAIIAAIWFVTSNRRTPPGTTRRHLS